MNETAQTETESETPDVIAAGHAARAKIIRFEEELADREAEAERARVAFEREPTPKGHTDREVAAQKAKNAKGALEALREELRPALDACEQAERAALIEKLTAEALADRPTFDAEIEAIRHHIDIATRDLRVMLDALHSHVGAYNERANRLPRGAEMAHRISVERLLEKMNVDLAKTHGRGGQAGDHHRFCRLTLMKDSHREYGLILEFRQPCPPAWGNWIEG